MQRRQLATVSEIYDTYDFGDADIFLLYMKAPGPMVSIYIGVGFMVITFFLLIQRYSGILRALKDEYYSKDAGMKGTVFMRVFLAAIMQGGDAMYTIFSQTGIAFLFLGFFQTDYVLSQGMLILFYFLVTCLDVVRVFMAYREYTSLNDLVVTANLYRSLDPANGATKNRGMFEYDVDNVYQNVSRNALMVLLVFMAQILLTGFVQFETWQDRNECFEPGYQRPGIGQYASEDVCAPTGDWLTWLLYVLGIFVMNVYILGPGNNFGNSQQNPAFWLAVLLANKRGKSTISWREQHGLGMAGGHFTVSAWKRHDYRMWCRFICSTWVNGFCFRLLLHSLPIQLATKPNLLSVIRQSLGVIWIAGLDDAPKGIKLTVEELYKKDTTGSDDGVPPINLDDLQIGMLLSNALADNANLSVAMRRSMKHGHSVDAAIRASLVKVRPGNYMSSLEESEEEDNSDEDEAPEEATNEGPPSKKGIYYLHHRLDNGSKSSDDSDTSRWV